MLSSPYLIDTIRMVPIPHTRHLLEPLANEILEIASRVGLVECTLAAGTSDTLPPWCHHTLSRRRNLNISTLFSYREILSHRFQPEIMDAVGE